MLRPCRTNRKERKRSSGGPENREDYSLPDQQTNDVGSLGPDRKPDPELPPTLSSSIAQDSERTEGRKDTRAGSYQRQLQAAMLKAIHAQEDRAAARQKAEPEACGQQCRPAR